MNQDQIKKWIKEAHDNAVEHGFYDCLECGGTGQIAVEKHSFHTVYNSCSICEGSTINPNKNIGELLMLIVSELGEALEAHRCGRFADWNAYCSLKMLGSYDEPSSLYNRHIKDTFEDEIADVFIRLFDLCGYINRIITISGDIWLKNTENIADQLLYLTRFIVDENLYCFFNGMIQFCKKLNIPIEKHIKGKMAYNKTRPYKHGKTY